MKKDISKNTISRYLIIHLFIFTTQSILAQTPINVIQSNQLEQIEINEIKEFCKQCDYETRFVEKDFIPKTPEDRLLLTPPQKNLQIENWNLDKEKEDNLDINAIKENLEKLL